MCETQREGGHEKREETGVTLPQSRGACSYQELEEARRHPPLEPTEGA